ncbi:hypothetical protein RUM43_011283 [Polyplax serrata]|uniref:Uncharacterized protein n=1 Tax=Polyplax serrata TaxID=468196 RepID=A0AAN8NLW6_POLSC
MKTKTSGRDDRRPRSDKSEDENKTNGKTKLKRMEPKDWMSGLLDFEHSIISLGYFSSADNNDESSRNPEEIVRF